MIKLISHGLHMHGELPHYELLKQILCSSAVCWIIGHATQMATDEAGTCGIHGRCMHTGVGDGADGCRHDWCGAVHVHSVRHRRIKLISMNCRWKILHFWRARLQALRLAAGGLRAPPRPNKPVDRCHRTPPSAARARSLSRPRRLIMERGTMLFTKPKHPTPTHSRTATNQARRRSEVWRSRRASSPSPAVCRHQPPVPFAGRNLLVSSSPLYTTSPARRKASPLSAASAATRPPRISFGIG
jgi:hypothetical protein